MHRTSLGLAYINTGPCHVIWFYCWLYTCITIQLNISPSVIEIPRQIHVRYIPLQRSMHRKSIGLVYINMYPVMLYDFTVHHMQVQVFSLPYLRRYFTYLDNSICVIIPSWCRIHCISLRLFYMNSRPCHIIWFYRCSYTCIRIQFNVSPWLYTYLDNSIWFIIPSWCRIHRISLGLVYITTRPCHIIWFYHCSYTGIRI
jgi:hypothetical protein